MKVTRKDFLSTIATAAVGAALSPSRLFAQARAKVVLSDRFAHAIGSTFRIRRSEGSLVDVRLERVDQIKSDATSNQFSLEFVAENGETLEEKTYTFEHDRMGEIPIFIKRTHTDADGKTWYRADFNLLVK